MIRYLIIMLTSQVVFLLVYDLFLKKETFFNWNRVYLLLTPLLSMVLPFISIDALKTTAPEPLSNAFPVIFLEPSPAVIGASAVSSGWDFTAWQWVALSGSLVALLFFIYKLVLIFRLRYRATIRRFREYLQVEIAEGEMAFSFFRHIFLGRKVLERKHDHIIEHELVHIREGHTWDLLYFELLRILFWFNPLVYVYQGRITELHEYIADSKMAGSHKKETYQYLLEEVFQTQKISFINSFFNHSLIKKRIVMLHQNRSKQIKKFKYLLMLPLILGMLVYTSCEQEVPAPENSVVEGLDPQLQKYYHEYQARINNGEALHKIWYEIRDEDPAGMPMSEEVYYRTTAVMILKQEAFNEQMGLTDGLNKELSRLTTRSYSEYLEWANSAEGKAKIKKSSEAYFTFDSSEKKEMGSNKDDHPFTTIPVKPSFKTPCEDGQEIFQCFVEKLNAHVVENFHYPVEAKAAGHEGKVYVNFRIDTEGNVKVINSRAPYKSLEQEAINIIESLPQLNPGGDEDGNPVNVTFVYPIVFKLG